MLLWLGESSRDDHATLPDVTDQMGKPRGGGIGPGGFFSFVHVWGSFRSDSNLGKQFQHILKMLTPNMQNMGCTLALWEGPTELLLAKVKNASGRIGIFRF